MFILTTSVQIWTDGLANAIRQEKEINCMRIRKERLNLSLLTDDMIIYVEKPYGINNNKKLLELVNKFIMFLRHKINKIIFI